MAKLAISDSKMDMIMKMGNGNPGAMNIIMNMLDGDMDKTSKNVMLLCHLDHFEVYGSDLYVLFNDVCHQSPGDFEYLIRAAQMGLVTKEQLHEACRWGQNRCFGEISFDVYEKIHDAEAQLSESWDEGKAEHEEIQ